MAEFTDIFKLQLDTESVIAGITKANGAIDNLDAGLIEAQTQLAKTEQRMSSLKQALDKTMNPTVAVKLANELKSLTVEQTKLNNVIKQYGQIEEGNRAKAEALGNVVRKQLQEQIELSQKLITIRGNTVGFGAMQYQKPNVSAGLSYMPQGGGVVGGGIDPNTYKAQADRVKDVNRQLGMSFTQIGRELPSLAIGLNTFLLAISNNLPMFTDNLKKLKDANAELVKSGGEAPSMFNALTGAIFSWQTAITIGITLLTLYGEKLIRAVAEMLTFKEALGLTIDQQIAFQKQNEKASQQLTQMYETYKYARGVLSGLTEEQKNYQKEVDKLNKTKAEGFTTAITSFAKAFDAKSIKQYREVNGQLVEIKEKFEEVGGVVRRVTPDFIGVFDKSGSLMAEFNVKLNKFDTTKPLNELYVLRMELLKLKKNIGSYVDDPQIIKRKVIEQRIKDIKNYVNNVEAINTQQLTQVQKDYLTGLKLIVEDTNNAGANARENARAILKEFIDIRDISKQLADMELDVKQNEADRALDKSKKNLEQIKTHYDIEGQEMANYIIARNELTEAIEHSYDVKKEKAESEFKFSIKAIDDENKKIREQIEIVNYNAEQQKKVAKDKAEIQRIEIDRINSVRRLNAQRLSEEQEDRLRVDLYKQYTDKIVQLEYDKTKQLAEVDKEREKIYWEHLKRMQQISEDFAKEQLRHEKANAETNLNNLLKHDKNKVGKRIESAMFERQEIENNELKAEHERELREANKIQDLDERLNAEFAINEKYINKSNELSRKHTTESAEYRKLEKQAIKDQVADYADYTHSILSAANNLAQQLLSMKIQEVEQQQRIQGDRIKEAEKLAERGNAQSLKIEKDRMESLNKEKAKFVKQQQALNSLMIISETAVAVAKAAAEGGAAAYVTIAAALIALAAGLAQARAMSSQAGYYDGGYTGDGNRREVAGVTHKGEMVMNHKTTSKYRDVLEGVHEGRINLNEWRDKVNMFEALTNGKLFTLTAPLSVNNNPNVTNVIKLESLEKRIDTLTNVVRGNTVGFNIDENGFSRYVSNTYGRYDKLKKATRLVA